MKRWSTLMPYAIIAAIFFIFLAVFHPQVFQYRMSPALVHDYIRSQDIEDPQSLIHDRIFMSDSDIYIASGYLYAKGANPTSYNFQHPPFVKYLFGFSTLLTGNPLYIQIIFGFALLCFTYFLGTKLGLGNFGYLGSLGLLIDPVFGGMMSQALLDLGQAVFALSYIILTFFYPESWIFQGIVLGLFAASKFWSTVIIFIIVIFGYKIYILKDKINFKKVLGSFLLAFVVFLLTYTKAFTAGNFNIFAFLAKDLKFMISHNSASSFGGPVILFITGFFAPWWQPGVLRATDWSLLWPVGLVVGVVGGFGEFMKKIKTVMFFCYLLPITYLILESTQVPFTRYFIIILPLVYLGFANLVTGCYHTIHDSRKT